ncbi:hypothetical protein HERIO_2407 [Hepatospora eriocheir]|uniref:Uncharacterized protein n=1 Tax=Hepatospora eriocheir TaxID=1081669 RepID=A0A1X0Q714_9MICR|nr:hypothetical protein HERIO_2407 [Hepatospora eriocheir]
MNHWYSSVLELLLRRLTKNLIEFPHTKSLFKRYMKRVFCQQNMETRLYSKNRGILYFCVSTIKFYLQ